MKYEVFEGKNIEELKEQAFEKLRVTENEVIIKTEEKKAKLFKSATKIIKVIKISDIAKFIKEKLQEILSNMNIEAQIETSIRDDHINLKMYSDKNNILIGKNGKTLQAFQTILRQMVHNEIEVYPYIILDVENYKEKREMNLERNVRKIAREVLKTKISVKLDNMNSYERRIVHNALTRYKNITSESEGEEPNRHIVISYKED